MNKHNFRFAWVVLAVHLCFVGCNGKELSSSSKESVTNNETVARLPYYSDADFTPHWFENDASVPDGFHRIPPFVLTNQYGATVTEKDFGGKIVVADFFFTTCPGICLDMTHSLKNVQDAFLDKEDVLLISHSVTPSKDTPSVLQSYAKRHGALKDKWHMVTGQRETIYQLGRQHYFVEESIGATKKPDEFIHTENFVLLDKKRHIRGVYNGLNAAEIRHLISDIKLLQKEKP